ncbi:MAG: sensor histidine kinase [Methylomicrobium sp.]
MNIAVIKSVIPGLIEMQPLTAVAFMLAGTALWLLREQNAETWQYRMGRLCAGGTTVICAVVLCEFAVNASFGIDGLLFHDSVMSEHKNYPGRPAMSTAFCLLVSGAALLFLDSRQSSWVPRLALHSLFFSQLAVFGYAYGVSSLSWIVPHTGMALHTSLLLVMLNLGILAARPEQPFMTVLSTRLMGSLMARRLLPVVVLFPFSLGWLRLIGQQKGWYGTEFGLALLVTVIIVVFAAQVYWTAGLLNRSDAQNAANLKDARDSEERLRLAWKATREAIWDWVIEHDSQYWSEAGATVFGWREVVDIPQPLVWWSDRLHPEDRARVETDFHAALADPERKHWEDEYRFLRADGCYADVLDRGFVIRDNHGKPVRMIGAMQDITERKRAEDELLRLNTELERRVQERTAELRRREEQLKTSLDEKDVLLKEIHHRVKNNLQIIASLLQLQSDAQADAKTRDLFQDSRGRIRSMALIHEQLYKSKDLKTIDFTDYITQLVNHIRRSFAQTTLNATVRLDIPSLTLDIDHALPLGLIINELVSNSFKYAFLSLESSERKELWVTVAQDASDGLVLEVGDSGSGLPDELDLEHLLSMGLQLVQSLVLQLNGRLAVQRRPGTLFRIIIPWGEKFPSL